MHIQFCGAAEGVTGSCHLITTEKHKVLLDCGMFQGGAAEDKKNYEPFPFNPAEIECVILSHAHIDHCGRLPLLVTQGFKGKIYCTDATADLLDVMLKDSGFIQEKEAEDKNRKGERAGRPPVKPLYTYNDALDTLKFVQPFLYDQLAEINDQMKIVFNDAGHILGSAITELWVTEENGKTSKIVFSGDLGVVNRPILRDPTIIKSADYVIMETTYGNRLHAANSMSVHQLLDIVLKTTDNGGTVVIPSFAVGRTQELIFEFNRFYEQMPQYKQKLEKLNVYIDSPMATTATQVFRKNAHVFDEETTKYILEGDNPLDFKNLKFTRSSDESRQLNFDGGPKIIISASGMCEAGRIRHHLKHNLWNPKSAIIFVGYQAEGSLGRMLVNGVKSVRLFGEDIAVKAQIYNLEGFSGHADMQGLLNWLRGFRKQPQKIFLVHGEAESKQDFANTVRKELGYECTIINGISEYQLESGSVISRPAPEEDRMDTDSVRDMKLRISKIHEGLENILYNTNLAVDDALPPERASEINNIILELEKQTLNLGSSITRENNNNMEDKADAEDGAAVSH